MDKDEKFRITITPYATEEQLKEIERLGDRKRRIGEIVGLWPFLFLFRLAFLIFFIDLSALLRNKPFHMTSTIEFLSFCRIPWADAPTFWLGLHESLSTLPISGVLTLLSFGWVIIIGLVFICLE